MKGLMEMTHSIKSFWAERAQKTLPSELSLKTKLVELWEVHQSGADYLSLQQITALKAIIDNEQWQMPLARSNFVDLSVALFILGYVDSLNSHTEVELLVAVNTWCKNKGYPLADSLTVCHWITIHADSQRLIN